MSDHLYLYEGFRSVPQEAQKTITGGRLNGKTDINPMWRIKALTEAFGACGFGWWYEIIDKRLERTELGEVSAFVDIALYYVVDGQTSKPVYGTGGSAFIAKEKAGLYVSDECFKMALTDAISVACKALGVGADVYWSKDNTKYSKPQPAEEPQSTPESVAAESEKMRKIILDLGKSVGRDEPATKMFAEAYIEKVTGAFVAWDEMTIGHLASAKVALAKRIEDEKKK